MAYGFGDFLGDVLTGGAYSATKTAIGLAEQGKTATGAMAAGLDSALGPGVSSGIGSQASGAAENGRYGMEGDFFFDSRSGRVWKFNSSQSCLIEVEKRINPLLSQVIVAAVDAQIQKQKAAVESQLKKIPQAQKGTQRKAWTKRLVTPLEDLKKRFA